MGVGRRLEAVLHEMERIAALHRPSCGGFAWCNLSLPLEQRHLADRASHGGLGVDLLVKEITPKARLRKGVVDGR